MKFDKNMRCVIECSTDVEKKKILQFFEKNGILWANGEKATELKMEVQLLFYNSQSKGRLTKASTCHGETYLTCFKASDFIDKYCDEMPTFLYDDKIYRELSAAESWVAKDPSEFMDVIVSDYGPQGHWEHIKICAIIKGIEYPFIGECNRYKFAAKFLKDKKTFTEMTISQIEQKYGIKNLKIIKE